jgi:hypothetical protein
MVQARLGKRTPLHSGSISLAGSVRSSGGGCLLSFAALSLCGMGEPILWVSAACPMRFQRNHDA